jgi:O-antigen ligase
MATPESRLAALAALLLAALLLILPWMQGGRSPTAHAAMVLLLTTAAAGLAGTASRPLLRPSPLLGLVVALVAAAALQSLYPDRTVQSLLLLAAYALAAVLAAHTAQAVPWAESLLVGALLASALVVAAAGGLAQLRGAGAGLYAGVLTGPFGYPNAAAGFLLAGAGAGLALAAARHGWVRAAAGGAAGLALLGLVLTRSRGALLALAVGLLVLPAVSGRRRRRAWSGLAVAAAGLLVLAVGWVLGRELLPALATGSAGSSAGWRLHILGWTWQIVRAHPWTGVGPGAFPVALKHVQAIPYVSGENPHNLYLELAAEYGLPAGMLALGLLAAFLLRVGAILRGAHAGGAGRPRLALLLATLTAMAFHAGIEMLSGFPAIPLAAATLGGLTAGRAGLTGSGHTPPSGAWRRVLLVVLLAVAGASLARFAAASLVQEGRAALAEGRVAKAAPPLRRALWLNPLSFPAHRWLSRALLAEGAAAEAVRLGDRAVRLAPRDPDTLALAGENAAAAGRWDAAVTRFRAAAELAPAARLRYYAGLMEAMAQSGRGAEARWWYERAALLFTPERMAAEGRCLAPGDRYLFGRLSRLAAELYATAGDRPAEAAAQARGKALAQPETAGICAVDGRPGQTSPEAAVGRFWTILGAAGWAGARHLVLPDARARIPAAYPAPRAEVRGIFSLAGDEHAVILEYDLALQDGSEWRPVCTTTRLRFQTEGWFLEAPPGWRLGPCGGSGDNKRHLGPKI